MQKTAYEQSSRDWRSDVCSADLSSSLAWIAAAVGAVIVAILIAFSMGVFSGEGDNVAVAAAPPPEPAPIPQAEETPGEAVAPGANGTSPAAVDRKSTRLNSSH